MGHALQDVMHLGQCASCTFRDWTNVIVGLLCVDNTWTDIFVRSVRQIQRLGRMNETLNSGHVKMI
eukprot:4520459-Ditylum_brightwellii.AAC.1